MNDLHLWKHLKCEQLDVPAFHTQCWAFLFVSVEQWAPRGGLQKSKLAFSSHIFLIKVLVFTFAFALSGGMLNAKGEILKNTLYFPFSDGNKGGWLESWIKAARWLNSKTRHSSSSLPRALVFLLSSCGPYLHPGVQQSQRSPGEGIVSGPARMEKVPRGEKHLWICERAG